MSWKEDYIERHGRAAYEKRLADKRKWGQAHPEVVQTQRRAWNDANPEKVEEHSREQGRKGGKRYERTLKYKTTGLQGDRNKVRANHGQGWRPYKQIIAPDSQIHHSWFPGTSKYDCIALVEANAHRHGIIDIIKILDGELTVFTEEELRNRGDQIDK